MSGHQKKILLSILVYCVLFFFGTNIAFKLPELSASFRSDSDQQLLLALVIIAVVAGAWAYLQLRRNGEASTKKPLTELVVPLLATAISTGLLFVYLWPFDLDDKWVYYRISRIVLDTGLPLYNPTEPIFIGASFLYPYFLAPGHFFGDWPAWEVYEKVLGIVTHVAVAALLLWHFRLTPLGLVVTAATALYIPALLWALGGLDTTLATLWLVAAALLYLRNIHAGLWFWVLSGCLMWIRPDAILVGVGTFALLVLLEPRNLRAHFQRGLLFSTPIVTYMAVNYGMSGYPLPTVFYVKGWNKAFSGTYPLYYDTFIGGSHLLSAILCSIAITVMIVVLVAVILDAARARSTSFIGYVRERRYHYSLLVGIAVYLGYHVMGGYQHMNFTFRYWIPGIIAAFVVCADMLRGARGDIANAWGKRTVGIQESQFGASVLVSAMIVQSALLACYVKYVDITPTYAPLRDKFSVTSYADYIRSWLTAGNYLRNKVDANSRVFLYAMAPGAFTSAYLVDPYYFAPHHSKFKDLATCKQPQPQSSYNCMIYYDYVVTNNPETFPSSHEVEVEFTNLTILRRKDLGPPSTPVLLTAKRNTPTTVLLNWQDVPNEYWYEVEVENRDDVFVRVSSVPAGYTYYELHDLDTTRPVKVRVRSRNPNGLSEPSNIISVE